MQLRVLSKTDLERALDMPTAIEAVANAFASLSAGRADVPLRTPVETAEGVTLFMPARLQLSAAHAPEDGPILGAKVVSVFGGNAERGEPAIHALVLLVDPRTGKPVAVMEGGWLTALRTGAATGVATRYLARPDARVLAVFGAGVQARTQIEAVRCQRTVEEVRIVSASGSSARRLAAELEGVVARAVDDPREALAGADIVVAATDSARPVFPAEAVAPGTHVSAVGSFTPQMQEIPADFVVKASVFVDEREAAWAEAGDLIIPLRAGAITHDHVKASLGELVEGRHAGRATSDELTFFKSVGNAVQDLAVASVALERAESEGLGQLIEL